MKKIVFIGFGAMAQSVLKLLPDTVQLMAVIASENSYTHVCQMVPAGTQVVRDANDISGQPDLVLEMAGQAGLHAHAANVLARRWPLAVISVGALADKQLADELQEAARKHQTKIHLLSGAVAGMDGLNAASCLGLEKVQYQGRKPPAGWKGSHAEKLVDLANLTEPTVFFTGSAREAARLFPANSNVAATIGFAGIGLDDTEVQLIADPHSQRNSHTIHAQGQFGEMRIELQGIPLPDNPKTSTLAALSVVRACKQLEQAIII